MKRTMSDGYVYYRCRMCGDFYKAKDRNYKPTCTYECGWLREMEAITAMQNKTGKMYEKWATKQAIAKMNRQSRKGGLTHREPRDIRLAN